MVSVYAVWPPAAPEPMTMTSYVWPSTPGGSMKGMLRARSRSYGADPECISQRIKRISAGRHEFVRNIPREATISDSTRHGAIVELLAVINLVPAGHATGVEMPDPLNVVLNGP